MSAPSHDRPLQLEWLPGRYAVCQLEADAPVPEWAIRMNKSTPLSSITRTDRELSIVCDETLVPDGVQAERGFVASRVVGTLDFSLTGIIARLTVPLAEAGVPVFVVSTFETDYLLVRVSDVASATKALAQIQLPSPTRAE